MSRIALAFLLVTGLVLPLTAQIQNARIEGTVSDSSSASIPGAKIAVVNTRTKARMEAETNAQGFYFFPTLQPGFYNLTAEANGFRKFAITAIEVNTGVSLRQDMKLELGTVTDTIVVEASGVSVQTTEATVQRTITNGAKAEYGRNAGATVELITRSGTNSFHGNLFEYHRNTVLNANNFFNKSGGVEIARPKFIQNQYGGSIGGPVVLPKVFNGK